MKIIAVFLALVVMSLSGCVTLSGDLPSLLDRPVIKVFTATPAVISAGEACTLAWTVSGANSAYIDQGIGNVALSGSTTVAPQVTTTYTITSNNAAGNSTARCQVTVRGSTGAAGTTTVTAIQTAAPSINYFKAEPQVISMGSYATLTWDVANSTSISISPDVGPVEPHVSIMVSPQQTTVYTLTASNAYGQTVTGVTVAVSQAGQPQFYGSNAVDLPLLTYESGSLTKSGSYYNKSGTVCIGDTAMNLPSRAFLSFDISAIPANAVIDEAVLDLGTYTIAGNPSYTLSGYGNMGALEIYQYQYGQMADAGRLIYEFPATMLGSFKITDLSGAPMQLNITADSSGNNIVGRLLAESQQRCQFRLQFFTTTNWDSRADVVCVENAKLRIKYSVR